MGNLCYQGSIALVKQLKNTLRLMLFQFAFLMLLILNSTVIRAITHTYIMLSSQSIAISCPVNKHRRTYTLCGMVVHKMLHRYSGHYTSFVKSKLSDTQWMHMDDAEVSKLYLYYMHKLTNKHQHSNFEEQGCTQCSVLQ